MINNTSVGCSHRRSLVVLSAIFIMLSATPAWAVRTAPDATGLWRIMDGSSPEPVSLVALSENKGILSGTVMRVMHSTQGEHPVCKACKEPLKDKAIVGMTILWDLKRKGTKPIWSGGYVLDPSVGETYKCTLTLKDADTLEVRGFMGISMFGRTKVWKRAQPIELTAPIKQQQPESPSPQ